MKYDFDKIVPRRHTDSAKWDEASQEDIIPLWVADMDFPTFPAITEALHRRVDHGIFGYTHVPQSYYESVVQWMADRHRVHGISPRHFIVTSGVVPAVSAIIRALTLPADKVLVMTPVYNCFFSSIRNQGCLVEASPLIYTGHTYQVDWDDFERRCADPRVRLFLLCNPHNPAGRVWTERELARIHQICSRHGVFVVADEIHGEIVMPGFEYCSYAACHADAADQCALCVSPTKAFNIAGLQIANIIVRDGQRRERIDRAINLHEVCDVNPFGVAATQAAYTPGGWEWLQQLNEYIFANYLFLRQTLAQELPQATVVDLEGTYLAWIDCSAWGKSARQLADHLFRHYRVWVNEGDMYGEANRPFLRVNLACPRATLQEGVARLVAGLRSCFHL